jgi:hypothetical protein
MIIKRAGEPLHLLVLLTTEGDHEFGCQHCDTYGGPIIEVDYTTRWNRATPEIGADGVVRLDWIVGDAGDYERANLLCGVCTQPVLLPVSIPASDYDESWN